MPVLTKINSNVIAEDAITGDKFAADTYLANTANQNISGTYSENRLYTSDAYTLSGNATINSHITLSTVKPTDDVVLTGGGAYTLTGTGTLSGGDMFGRETLTGMSGTIGSTITGSPNLNLGNSTFPVGHIINVEQFTYPKNRIGTVTSNTNTFTGNAVAQAIYSPRGGGNNRSFMFCLLHLNIEIVGDGTNARLDLEESITGSDITNVQYNVGDFGGHIGASHRTYGADHSSRVVQLDGTGNADIEFQYSLKNENASANTYFTCYGDWSSITVFEYQG